MPPVVAVALGLMGAAALVRWCVKEAQRVNASSTTCAARAGRAGRPQRAADLKRDPQTGEYRPG